MSHSVIMLFCSAFSNVLFLEHFFSYDCLASTAFSSMVEGKNEELSTAELSGGARIHYIFQSIFVKSLEVPSLNYCDVYVDPF